MEQPELVQVQKTVLQFPVGKTSSPNVTSSDTLAVTNITSQDVTFKVKTTNQLRYIVRPNIGVIPAEGQTSIMIALQPFTELPTLGHSKDKFLLMVAVAPDGLPVDYWPDREGDDDVVKIRLKVEFVSDPGLGDEVLVDGPIFPRVGDAAQTAATKPVGDEPDKGREIGANEVDELLQEKNYEAALERARELQAMLDAKNLELARLRAELVETKAESERVLKDAPKVPLAANKVLSDPYGGVSIAGYGVMLLLFLVLVAIVFRVA